MLGRRRRTPRTATTPRAAALAIAGYDDFRLIGNGGFSRVYTARQLRFSRTVAVKVITAELSDDARRRFAREQATAGSLDGHPHVIRVYDSGVTDDGRPYLTMEHHEAGSLADRLGREGPLPVADALAIGVKLACALDAAHRRGIVHRDVKPQNVLLSPFVGPVLADFGIAAVDDARLRTVTGEAFSALHVAPEVLDGLPATPSADLYSLTSTLYELLAGRAPFADAEGDGLLGLMRRVRLGGVPPIDRPDVPGPVADTVRDLLERPPGERPPSGMALAALLRELEAGLGLDPTPLVDDPRRPDATGAPATTVATPAATPAATTVRRAAARVASGAGTAAIAPTPAGVAEADAGAGEAPGDAPTPGLGDADAGPVPSGWPGTGEPSGERGGAELAATVDRQRPGRRADGSTEGPTEAPARSRRPLVVAAALVAVAGVAAFAVARPGGGEADDDGGDAAGPPTTEAPATTAAPTTTPTTAPATTAATAPPTTAAATTTTVAGTVVPAAGTDGRRACDPIRAAGLVCAVVEERATSPHPPGAVLRQEPAAGTSVAPGSTVTLHRDVTGAWPLVAVHTPDGARTVLTIEPDAAAALAGEGWGRDDLGTLFSEQAPGTVPLYCYEPNGTGPVQGYAYVLDTAQLQDSSWYRACDLTMMGYVYPGGEHGDTQVYAFRDGTRWLYSTDAADPAGLALGPADPMFTIWR